MRIADNKRSDHGDLACVEACFGDGIVAGPESTTLIVYTWRACEDFHWCAND
jgi:hypothetical protein